MTLERYCTVAEAAEIAGVTPAMIRYLVKTGALRAERPGHAYLLLREDVARYQRTPGEGRPKRVKKVAKRKPRKAPPTPPPAP
jgi:excisionase family DNA binding protein